MPGPRHNDIRQTPQALAMVFFFAYDRTECRFTNACSGSCGSLIFGEPTPRMPPRLLPDAVADFGNQRIFRLSADAEIGLIKVREPLTLHPFANAALIVVHGR